MKNEIWICFIRLIDPVRSLGIITLFLVFMRNESVAQSTFSLEYNFTQNLVGIPIDRRCLYEFDSHRSFFTNSIGKGWVSKDIYGNIGDETLSVTFTGDQANGRNGTDGYMLDSIGNVIFIDFKDKKIHVREIIRHTPYIFEEPVFDLMQWSISKDTTQISSYLCYRASTQFRGRDYTAWFSYDLPPDRGPGKFKGLPGTILRVEDRSGQIKYEIRKIRVVKGNIHTAHNPKTWTGKSITFEAYKTIYYKEKRKQFAQFSAIATTTGRIEPEKLTKSKFVEYFEELTPLLVK